MRKYYELPPYLRKAFEFPYQAGARFVEALCARGGWALVDEAHRSPPATSAEIIYPELFLDEDSEPVDAPPLGAPGRDWDDGYEISFGAADLLLMFELPGGSEQRALDDPREKAAGWAAGSLVLWSRGEDNAIGIALSEREDGQLCPAIAAWYFASFPNSQTVEQEDGVDKGYFFQTDEQVGMISCGEAEVTVAIAPDEQTARSILAAS